MDKGGAKAERGYPGPTRGHNQVISMGQWLFAASFIEIAQVRVVHTA